MNIKIYRVGIQVGGNFCSSYAFEDEDAADQWIENTLPKLIQEHGIVVIKARLPLEGLQVGDFCHVLGQGTEIFQIVKSVEFGPDRPGFILDGGWSEEVINCSRVLQTSDDGGSFKDELIALFRKYHQCVVPMFGGDSMIVPLSKDWETYYINRVHEV